MISSNSTYFHRPHVQMPSHWGSGPKHVNLVLVEAGAQILHSSILSSPFFSEDLQDNKS